jgi:hypothetical protein
MKIIMAALAAFLLATLATPAQAKHRHHHNRSVAYEYDGRIIAHPAGCPRTAFCGCGASVRIFGHPVRNLYLASNWFRFPRANPAPGMAAVRNHHVMVIEAVDGNGNAIWRCNERRSDGYHARADRYLRADVSLSRDRKGTSAEQFT